MDNHALNGHTRMGTVGGIVLIFIANIKGEDVLKTIVLSIVGATVSFAVSYGWKKLLTKRKS